MRKVKAAILNALSCGDWMSSNDIASTSGIPKATVKASLNNLLRTGLAVKKDDPEHPQFLLWKRSGEQSGFGVSHNMAEFDKFLREVRQ